MASKANNLPSGAADKKHRPTDRKLQRLYDRLYEVLYQEVYEDVVADVCEFNGLELPKRRFPPRKSGYPEFEGPDADLCTNLESRLYTDLTEDLVRDIREDLKTHSEALHALRREGN